MKCILIYFLIVKTEITTLYQFEKSDRLLEHDNYQVRGYPIRLPVRSMVGLSGQDRTFLIELTNGTVTMYKAQYLIWLLKIMISTRVFMPRFVFKTMQIIQISFQYTHAYGIPILSSDLVSDDALKDRDSLIYRLCKLNTPKFWCRNFLKFSRYFSIRSSDAYYY